MQHPQLPVPPRYGNWNANVELLSGAKFPALGNPYLPYIKQRMEKNIDPFDFPTNETVEDTLCGKPHNNGEDTCLECEVIKKGV